MLAAGDKATAEWIFGKFFVFYLVKHEFFKLNNFLYGEQHKILGYFSFQNVFNL